MKPLVNLSSYWVWTTLSLLVWELIENCIFLSDFISDNVLIRHMETTLHSRKIFDFFYCLSSSIVRLISATTWSLVMEAVTLNSLVFGSFSSTGSIIFAKCCNKQDLSINQVHLASTYIHLIRSTDVPIVPDEDPVPPLLAGHAQHQDDQVWPQDGSVR